MINTVKGLLRKQKENITNFPLRIKNKNKDFTIISNNCWGGKVYQDLDIEYKTPFIGLFLYSPCYIKLLKNLKHNLSLELQFADKSKYEIANKYRETKNKYPIGILGDIELHFLHYKDEKEAKEKWNRRIKRINWNNIYVKMDDIDLCTKELLIEFDKLDYKNKVCFTAQKYNDIKSNIHFSEFNGKKCVGGNELLIYKKYFDVVKWLNN